MGKTVALTGVCIYDGTAFVEDGESNWWSVGYDIYRVYGNFGEIGYLVLKGLGSDAGFDMLATRSFYASSGLDPAKAYQCSFTDMRGLNGLDEALSKDPAPAFVLSDEDSGNVVAEVKLDVTPRGVAQMIYNFHTSAGDGDNETYDAVEAVDLLPMEKNSFLSQVSAIKG